MSMSCRPALMRALKQLLPECVSVPMLRTLFVGAGPKAARLAKRMQTQRKAIVLGFVDSDPRKQGMEIAGAPVLGCVELVGQLVLEHRITQIVVTDASLSQTQIRSLLEMAERTGTNLKIVSGDFPISWEVVPTTGPDA